jgi:excisionase family DNA binding protein
LTTKESSSVKIGSDQLLTSSEVGELLQVNPSSVKKWVDDGLLLAFRTPGGHRRIRAIDLVSFLVRHEMPIPVDLQDAAKKRLLIVDDEVDQLKALARSLKRFADRVEVTTTSNGIDALVLVGSFHPHAVLLDVYMPGIDGLEVCRRLKKNPATKDVQVYVVSGSFTSALEQKALEAGAAKCIPKPIDVRNLLSIMFPTRGSEFEARAY